MDYKEWMDHRTHSHKRHQMRKIRSQPLNAPRKLDTTSRTRFRRYTPSTVVAHKGAQQRPIQTSTVEEDTVSLDWYIIFNWDNWSRKVTRLLSMYVPSHDLNKYILEVYKSLFLQHCGTIFPKRIHRKLELGLDQKKSMPSQRNRTLPRGVSSSTTSMTVHRHGGRWKKLDTKNSLHLSVDHSSLNFGSRNPAISTFSRAG